MQLYYRSQSYKYDPSKVESRKIEQPFQPIRRFGRAYNLMYRGVTYRVNPRAKSAKFPVSPVAYKLIYRGIIYFVNRTAQGEVTIVTQLASTSKA
ncbi:DUF4278 domain-containing protein [Dendronalium sp. ChiSLP03b]|uniref:DUF4278 domain-containing protein n=1 Tax=Dendronalium sp. ChiSLP03b TaxID=3075381 RepID=UPI002AD5605D|nr:DUF4278 domain-containing protein [Dendronalium sp. ChiSLP03b]MDZ8208082.1 DUF4278 domain-containing protein [Dendronalium sp. ChiSLP03b]